MPFRHVDSVTTASAMPLLMARGCRSPAMRGRTTPPVPASRQVMPREQIPSLLGPMVFVILLPFWSAERLRLTRGGPFAGVPNQSDRLAAAVMRL